MSLCLLYGRPAIFPAPQGSTALPKRRKKNHIRTWQSQTDSCTKSNAAEGMSTYAEKTLDKGQRNQVAYECACHSDGGPVATVAPILIRSEAPTHETQLFSKKISSLGFHDETKYASENTLSHDERNSPFTNILDEGFTPNIPEHTLEQLALKMGIDIDSMSTLKSIMGIGTAMNPDLSTCTSFLLPDFDFDNSKPSGPETTFDFTPEVAEFPLGNWYTPDFQTVLTPTNQVCADSPQPPPSGFCTDSEPDTISSSNGNEETCTGINFGRSLHNQSPDHYLQIQRRMARSSADSCSDIVECGTGISRILPSPLAISSGNGCRKRSSRSSRGTGRERPLACPFHKKDPQRHQGCAKYTLRRIKDVKQHIYRLHCKPELYCSRCFQNFKCFNERDHHIREGGCTKNKVPDLEGIISEDQRKELKYCGSRGTSKQQQWVKLWEVIFPGTKPPQSPHIENDQAELLSCLRSYWDGNAGEIIAKYLGEHDPVCLNPDQIRSVVDSILDHFETIGT
ncbi:hypothetical protein F5Y12DRAFT_759136 [Xylaria sp. FL1777]|nr:hypothetical protein F5Y12DRAFT_759136 [Xylaria sp. FL1777]